MTTCRLIIDPPQPGAWNMAVDEWLLRSAADNGVLTLRFYQWAEPTLSLGYFQQHVDRQLHAASLACPLVRRSSGGGALMHHHELTYSLAVPASHPLAQRAEELYYAVHETLVELLQHQASLAGGTATAAGKFKLCEATDSRGKGEPFLCFLRRSRGDVLFAPADPHLLQTNDRCAKLCGSAQRRHRGAVLQHGGILLARSPQAPELLGLNELLRANECPNPNDYSKPNSEAPPAITADTLRERWLEPLAGRLKLALQEESVLGEEVKPEIESIAAKFLHSEWVERR